MLTPFPDLLTYSFFAPTLLRLAAALAFAYSAYFFWTHRDKIAERHFPLIGRSTWIGGVAAAAHLAIAAMLGAGYYTQIAALLGALGSLKGALFVRRYSDIFPLSRTAYLLLVAILLSLLLTGAGAFARDLPL